MTLAFVPMKNSTSTKKTSQTRTYRTRTALTAGAVAVAFAAASLSVPPSAQAAEVPQVSAQTVLEELGPNKTINLSSEAGARQMTTLLESLPENLKTADPNTTKNYEERLNRALGGVKVAQKDRSLVGKSGELNPQINWWSCGLALAGVVAEYGIPVAKVLKWLKDGYKIFGGVKNLITAIRSGAAAAEIGEDAAVILGGILGINGVVTACS